MAAPNIIVESLPVDEIRIVGERRPVNEGAVADLVKSIERIGLQTPITVRLDKEYVDPDTGEVGPEFVLIAGRHRLEAFRVAGADRIPAIVRECTPVEAELWEIAENLHRADLTKDERDRYIRRYAELLEAKEARGRDCPDKLSDQSRLPDGRLKGPQHEPGIASKIAEQTGLSQRTVRRALKRPDPEIERQQQEAARIRREQDRAQRAVASEEYAGWLLSQVDLDQLPTLISWIEASPPRDVIAALRRLSNETPVMDARYGGDDDLPAFLDRRGRP